MRFFLSTLRPRFQQVMAVANRHSETVQPPGLPFPPDLAAQLHIARLVAAGTTAVFIWDILDNLVDDYHLFSKHKFRISGAVYLLSRIASFIYPNDLFLQHILGDCQVALVVFDCFFPIAAGATALLFFFRVRAVYGAQPLVTRIFGILWVCVVGTAIPVPISSHAVAIGRFCIVSKVPSYLGIAGTTLTLHDTSVFFAISFRLLSNSHIEYTPGQRVQALFRGANLHALSKALLRDGEKYYMMTIITNVLMISMVYAPGVSPIYRGVISIPNMALTSIMACRVYRNAKLHYVHIPHLSLPVTGDSNIGTPRFSVHLSAHQSGAHMETYPIFPQNVVDPSPPKQSD
ncbi:hypothetical protein B0H19DRAFT_1010477 [Mycena capillaripes]|nr:hypothetical protein B0H19DRAFT_1010477 [Mycena capillaripes]